MLLDHFLILLRLVHAQVIEEVSAMRDFAKESVAGGVIFLMRLKVLCEETDFLGQNSNLYGRRSRIFRMLTMLADECFFLRALEGHNKEGEKRKGDRDRSELPVPVLRSR